MYISTYVFLHIYLTGSQAVYLLGATTKRNGEIRPFSFGCWLGRFVHLYEYFDIKWLKKFVYDFNVDHWNFNTIKTIEINYSFNTISGYLIRFFQNKSPNGIEREGGGNNKYLNGNEDRGLFEETEEMIKINESLNQNTINSNDNKKHGLLKCLFKSPWLYSKDNAPYDMTIHAMNDLNSTSKIFKNTYYRTYAASMVNQIIIVVVVVIIIINCCYYFFFCY